jgi:hypothetical protein
LTFDLVNVEKKGLIKKKSLTKYTIKWIDLFEKVARELLENNIEECDFIAMIVRVINPFTSIINVDILIEFKHQLKELGLLSYVTREDDSNCIILTKLGLRIYRERILNIYNKEISA